MVYILYPQSVYSHLLYTQPAHKNISEFYIVNNTFFVQTSKNVSLNNHFSYLYYIIILLADSKSSAYSYANAQNEKIKA